MIRGREGRGFAIGVALFGAVNDLRETVEETAIVPSSSIRRKSDSMSAILSFRDLDAWKTAMDLVVLVYDLSHRLPKSEQFGLISQMQRACVSVPSNIAEGHASGPGGRYRWHVRTALGSVAELDTQLEVARRLEYVNATETRAAEQQLIRIRQLLHGLNRSLRRKQAVQVLLLAAFVVCGSTLLS
jgi:four helix bundle protein